MRSCGLLSVILIYDSSHCVIVSWTGHRSVHPSGGLHPKRLCLFGASAKEARSASGITCCSKQSRRHKRNSVVRTDAPNASIASMAMRWKLVFRACKSGIATHLTKSIIAHIAKLVGQRLSLYGKIKDPCSRYFRPAPM
jgi:hypothetical protein